MRNSIDGIGRDFTHALHALRRRPQVAIVTILTVGLAVGASTAIFSIVNAILIQPPPYRDAGRLAMLWNLNERIGYTLDDVTSRRGESMSPAEFLEWKKNAKIFDRMAAFDTRDYLLTGTDRPEMILGYVLAEGSFQTLGIQPMYGRLPTLEEERGTAIHVVLLRYDFWRRAYQSDPTVVGRTIQFNGVDHRILGILPPKFTLFSRACDFLSTLPFDERSLRNPYRGLRIIRPIETEDDHQRGAIARRSILTGYGPPISRDEYQLARTLAQRERRYHRKTAARDGGPPRRDRIRTVDHVREYRQSSAGAG